MIAFVGTSILVLFARGPHETGWVGWSGGTQLLRREAMVDLSPQAITEGRASRRRPATDTGPTDPGNTASGGIVPDTAADVKVRDMEMGRRD